MHAASGRWAREKRGQREVMLLALMQLHQWGTAAHPVYLPDMYCRLLLLCAGATTALPAS
jgi:hypothetical protein